MDWERRNVWTSTLYTLIHSLSLAQEQHFGDLTTLEARVKQAGSWRNPDCAYGSVLTAHPLGKRRITFRRDPNIHFDPIVAQVIQMLIQDLVVILDEMMYDVLAAAGERAGAIPQSKKSRSSQSESRRSTIGLGKAA